MLPAPARFSIQSCGMVPCKSPGLLWASNRCLQLPMGRLMNRTEADLRRRNFWDWECRSRPLSLLRIGRKVATSLESRDCQRRPALWRCWNRHPQPLDCSSNSFSCSLPFIKRAGFGLETRLAKHVPVQPASALTASVRESISRDGHKFTLETDCHSGFKGFGFNFDGFILCRCCCDAVNCGGCVCGHRHHAWRFAVASHD